MSFITLKCSYEKAKADRDKKVYEQTLASKTIEDISSKLAGLKATSNETALSKNTEYQKLVAMQSTYDTRKDKLDSEIALLDENIKSYKEAMKDGIKETFSLWCLG